MKLSTVGQSIELAAKAIVELVEDYKEHPIALEEAAENIAQTIARDAMNLLIIKQMEEGILSSKRQLE